MENGKSADANNELGVADKNARFVALVVRIKLLEAKETQLAPAKQPAVHKSFSDWSLLGFG